MRLLTILSCVWGITSSSQIKPDMYERMCQEREKYEKAVKMLNEALEHIENHKQVDLTKLRKFAEEAVKDLMTPPEAPIEYVGEAYLKSS